MERFGRNQTIRALKARLREKSEFEERHAARVAVYAVAIGSELGLPDEELLALRYAAELHDIGKLGFPDELFSGRLLTDAEKEIIRGHPEAAVGFLSEFEWLTPSLPGIVSHHERWDGGGYPYGLKETAIPIAARIVAVAEAFDAMTMPVGWREPISEKEALATMSNCICAQFDPDVVRAFLKIQPVVQPVGL